MFITFVIVLITVLAIAIFRGAMTGSFAIGPVGMFFYSGLIIMAPVLVFFHQHLVPSKVRTTLMVLCVLFIAVAVLRSTISVYSESALVSFDRGISGGFFYASQKVNPELLNNDTTASDYNKLCDEVTSEARADEEQIALNNFKITKDPAAYTAAREVIRKKYEAVKGCGTKLVSQTVTPSDTTSGTTLQSNEVLISGTSDQWTKVCDTDCTLSVSGEVDYGGEVANPESSPRMADKTAKASGIYFGVLIAKIGDGRPFKVGYKQTIKSGGKPVSVIVNDSDYRNNKGSFTVAKS